MHRTRLTFAVAAALCLSYQAYAQWAESFTQIEVEPPAPRPAGQAPALPQDLIDAARFLPDEEWLKHAKFTFQRSNQLYIYTDSAEIVDNANGNRVEFAPFVMVWMDPDHPDAPPYIVRCETARVQFENRFQLELGAGNPGRLVAAALDGTVAITGPDGLRIHGQNFVFSEESLHLYSDHPVSFHYGPRAEEATEVDGSGHGLQINLTPSFDGALGRDMPRVGGIKSIALRRDVVLDLTYEESHGKAEPQIATAHVTSDAGLEYHVEERYVSLGDIRLAANVVVEHPTGGAQHPEQADRLRCNLLALEFLPEGGDDDPEKRVVSISADSARSPDKKDRDDEQRVPNPFSGLRFSRLIAQGNRAALQSDEHGLVANMHQLEYDASSGTAVLTDAETVRIQRGETKLMCPRIAVWRDPEGDAQALQCAGQGELEQRNDETSAVEFRAFWDEQLLVEPDPATGLTVIRADGRARVIQPEQTGLMADHITLWVDRAALEDAEQERNVQPAAQRDRQAALPTQALKLALAEGNVVMAGPQFHVESTRLQATFEEGAVPDDNPDNRQTAGEKPAEEPEGEAEAWVGHAREFEVRVLHDPVTGNTLVAEALATGGVSLSQAPAVPSAVDQKPDEPVSLSGSRLHLVNAGGARQVVNLFGEPAQLRQGDMRLEGQDLRFDRAGNLASVVGNGLLQVPVHSALNGTELETPMLLDVQWQEGMTFDGSQARFLKNVLLRLNDSRLYCEEMTVGLTQRIVFADDRPDSESEEVQIKQVACRDGVRLEIYEWDQSTLTGIRKGELARFTLDYQTGEFRGQGPGVINDWARDGSRRIAIAPKAVAQANQPVDSDNLDWEHTNIRFSQTLQGNFKHKLLELNGRVRVLYAPVEHALETFSRDELSGDSPSAKHAVWLGCDTLSVTLHPWSDLPQAAGETEPRTGDYAMIGASGHCELEGQLFRAVADHLSYDQSKELFTLKGLGSHEASIYYQKQPGADPSRFPGQTIQFIPSQQRVKLEGSSGIQGVQ
jgi:hypothetical protein